MAIGIAIILVSVSRSPFDAPSLIGGMIAGVAVFIIAGMGMVAGLIEAVVGKERGFNRILPLLLNIAVVATFIFVVKVVHVGPAFQGGPAGF